MFTEKKSTAEALLPYYHKIKNAWSKESCSPSLQENWPNGNIARGQCFVTAVAVSEAFGGAVYELRITEQEIHYYNVIDGEIVDLTSEQFEENITSDFFSAGTPSDISLRMSDPIKRKRYAVLISRMNNET
ncbi:MAG: hypothetical protein E7446_08140 [Ruminococcaceae bacterium]|nr:hypothetical protein [Oscillospiraceae bacterium]